MKLEQTIAIVTGSSSGVGAATAANRCSRGKVVVNYVSKDQAAELVAEECRALGGEAVVCKGDVSDDAACQQLVQTATEHFGGQIASSITQGLRNLMLTSTWRV